MNDLIIIGGGPAGVAAGVYASRKQLKTVLITETFGGQSTVSEGIENWIGEIKISGIELAKKLELHLLAYSGDFVTIAKGERVQNVTKKDDGTFEVSTNKNTYLAKSVLVATGSSRRKLPAINADKFEHKGLTYCASCDGPIFSGQDVLVVGGGNSAVESAAQLLAYCNKVYLMHRRDEFRADPKTVESIKKNPKLEIITGAVIKEILGDNFVTGLKYEDLNTGEVRELNLSGIFVEIGANPAIDFVADLVDLDDNKHIKIDPWNQRTSLEGIWAAGDCTNILYHQNNIASGDAVKALEDIYIWINSQ